MRCAASAADSVMVITKSVAANPGEAGDDDLALQRGNGNEDEDAALAVRAHRATRLYIGSAPNSVRRTSTSVAMGESVPAARKAMLG